MPPSVYQTCFFLIFFLFPSARSMLVLLYFVLGANKLEFLFCRYPYSFFASLYGLL